MANQGIPPRDFAFDRPGVTHDVPTIDLLSADGAKPTTSADNVRLYADIELKAIENDPALSLDAKRTFATALDIGKKFDEAIEEANGPHYSPSGREDARLKARDGLEHRLSQLTLESKQLRAEVEVTDQHLIKEGRIKPPAGVGEAEWRESLKAVTDQMMHLDPLERQEQYIAALLQGDEQLIAAFEAAGPVFREQKEKDGRGVERVVARVTEAFIPKEKVAEQQLARGRERHPEITTKRDRKVSSANITDSAVAILLGEGARRVPRSVEEMTSNA